jgi:hypothetical protein
MVAAVIEAELCLFEMEIEGMFGMPLNLSRRRLAKLQKLSMPLT